MPQPFVFTASDVTIADEFALAVEVRFDDLQGASQQKVFDITDPATGARLWLGQSDGTNMELGLVQDGVLSRIVAEDVLREGETGTWRVTIDTEGLTELYKDGVRVSEGVGQIPAYVDRANQYVGQSN